MQKYGICQTGVGGFSERSVKAKPLDFFSKAPFKQFLINLVIFKN